MFLKEFGQTFSYSFYILYVGSLSMDIYCEYAKSFRKPLFAENLLPGWSVYFIL